jgi:hypothetical protein
LGPEEWHFARDLGNTGPRRTREVYFIQTRDAIVHRILYRCNTIRGPVFYRTEGLPKRITHIQGITEGIQLASLEAFGCAEQDTIVSV